MSNARRLSRLIVGTELVASNVDSDLSTKINSIKTRLDSDDSKIQSLSSSIASVSSAAGLLDSDLKVVADLRDQLDSEILFVRNLSLSYNSYVYNATDGQTSFTGNDANSATLAYTAGSIQVFLNGIKLEGDDYTASDGTSIVLAEAAITNAQLIIVCPKLESNYVIPPYVADWSNAPAETAAIQHSGPADNDYFGVDVGIDRNYAIVGAYGDDAAVSSGGAAYVFFKSGGSWSQQAMIGGDTNQDYFAGTAVAIGGSTEGLRVALGIPKYNLGNNYGRVMFYTRSGTTWTHQASINGALGASTTAGFGNALAMSGDTTVVGATAESSDTGRVYVYTGNGTLQQNIISSDAASGDKFGFSVDIDGDLMAATAPFKNGQEGACYVFERSGTTWTQKAKLVHTGSQGSDRLGYSVSCHEGANGTNTIAVGHNDQRSAPNPPQGGGVFVFTGSGTSYTQQAKIVPSDVATGDYFGSSDVNGRSISNQIQFDKGQAQGDVLFIGSSNDDDNSLSNSGSVYVFSRSGSTWSQTHKINAFTKGPSASANFGGSLDVDENGSLIVGAPNDDEGGTARGAAYIFDAQ